MIVDKLKKFHYSINDEILKGENVTISTNSENKNVEEIEKVKKMYKENKFLAFIFFKFHKDLFGNNENDPRIVAVSAKSICI